MINYLDGRDSNYKKSRYHLPIIQRR